MKTLSKISNNWLNDLLGTNIWKTFFCIEEFCWYLLLTILTILKWSNTASVISKQDIFSFLVILLAALVTSSVLALKV